MGKLFGKVTDAVGLTDYEGEEKAAKQAAIAGERAYAMSKEQVAIMKEELAFQKDQYQDWKDIYGELQDNLGDHYNSLDPDDYAVKGLQNSQREYQEAVKLIEKDAASKGLSGSGMEFGAKTAATLSNAMNRARIRTEAPQAVIEDKMQFLGLGLGQGTAMLGTITAAGSNANNAFSTGVNSQTTMNANYLQQQSFLSGKNTDAINDIAGTVSGYGFG